MCNSDYIQTTFFYLGRFMKHIRQSVLFNDLTTVSTISNIIQPFTMGVYWPEIGCLMEAMFGICIMHTAFLLCMRQLYYALWRRKNVEKCWKFDVEICPLGWVWYQDHATQICKTNDVIPKFSVVSVHFIFFC